MRNNQNTTPTPTSYDVFLPHYFTPRKGTSVLAAGLRVVRVAYKEIYIPMIHFRLLTRRDIKTVVKAWTERSFKVESDWNIAYISNIGIKYSNILLLWTLIEYWMPFYQGLGALLPRFRSSFFGTKCTHLGASLYPKYFSEMVSWFLQYQILVS